MSAGIIYSLVDPITHEVRYIGQTSQQKRRKWQHCALSNNKSGRRVSKWVRSLLETGRAPIFVMIEETDSLDVREVFWIAEHRRRGADLLNMNNGGTCVHQMHSAPRASTKGKKKTLMHQVRSDLTRTLSFFKKSGDAAFYLRAKEKLDEVNAAIERAVAREGKQAAFDRINSELARRRGLDERPQG